MAKEKTYKTHLTKEASSLITNEFISSPFLPDSDYVMLKKNRYKVIIHVYFFTYNGIKKLYLIFSIYDKK